MDLSDRAQLEECIRRVYGDAPWVDVDALVAQIWDVGQDPKASRRFLGLR